MIRILSIGNARIDGVEWWRHIRPLTELQRSRPNINITFLSGLATETQLMESDMVIMYRPVRPKSLEFLQNCKEKYGLKVILDIDDNLWRIPPGHPSEIDYLEYAQTLRQIYATADGIWSSTEAILPFADALDGRGIVVPNATLEQDLPNSPKPYRGVVLWRGSIAHFMDIYAEEADAEFQDNRDKFEHWKFMGYWPANMHGAKTSYQKQLDTVEYFDFLKNSVINIMWKPLAEIPFNDAKSNIAFIEATIAGGICVTNYAGKPGWEMAVDKFSNNPDFIAHQWALSRDWILEHYNLEKVNELRYQHIIKTLER